MVLKEKLTGSSQIGVFFDGDDTLWETQPLYTRAKKNFYMEMEKLGFDPVEAEQRFETIDFENVGRLGFSKARFPKSMSDTYQKLCLLYDKPVNELIRTRVEAIGFSTFRKKPRIFAYVPKVLKTLKALDLRLILATKGDKKVQEEKIKNSKLLPYFHRSYVLEQKSENELRNIVKECGLDVQRSWSIGNSVKSDINPALRIGMNAIWIPNKSWIFEEEEPLDKGRLFKASSIKEVPRIVISKTLEIRI